MPYLPTAQEWFTQSALLLEARPTTTRVTTKYSFKPPSTRTRRAAKPRKAREPAASSSATSTTAVSTAIASSEIPAADHPPQTTRATLTLKTYDPNSGATLKYQTDKAAEVGRLISSLSRLGRAMAGLPELKEVATLGAGLGEAAEVGSGFATPVGADTVAKTTAQGPQAGGTQGGKKGKKKGKK